MNKPNPNKNFFRSTLFYLVAFFALAGLFQLFAGNGVTGSGSTKELTSSEFMTQLDQGKIKSFEIQKADGIYLINGEFANGKVKKQESEDFISMFNGSKALNRFSAKVLDNDNTVKEITELAKAKEVKFQSEGRSNLMDILMSLPLLLLMIPATMMMFSMFQGGGPGGGKNVLNFGKSKTKDVSKQKVKVRFTDVAGAEEEKQELVEVVEFLKDPKRFTKLGARIPAGVLLEGPPGTGKTLLAKAVAGEAGVPFYSISGSEFVEMFVGVGASRVRDLFENAKKNAPAIIFIDEIDAVGRQRGTGMGGGHDEREQTLNQLLVEMDGFEGNEGVIVIAATNRSDVLDPALLRPGRFDRQILVGNPDVKGREAVLAVHARNKKISPLIDLKTIAQQTPGFSGADLENLLNEAALVAARQNHTEIMPDDLDEAHDRVIAGPAKKDRERSEKQLRTVAYHEAGHTVIGMVLNDARIVHKVTIVPRGRAGGYAIMLPKEDQFIVTKEELYQQVVGLLGGRVAEEIVFNSQSTGASNDFEQATRIVRSMITEYGMSDKLGTIQFEGNHKVFIGRDYGQSPAYSDQIAYEIDLEVRRMMKEAHDEAHRIITEHRQQLNVIAEKLLEVETLDKAQIKALFETGQMPEKAEHDQEPLEQPDDFQEAKEKAQQSEDQVHSDHDQTASFESEQAESKVRQALEDGKPVISQEDGQDRV
ncbi:ATP-dependent zinc metalloprotease FtsH [Vaginisenegalia massiliensis]|uniref:ATP-dependent zinc metalloprotease FtsH n=1 Tax=Vaginisenegalia massiliensis TaxID=2058294 RepID=UPI000F5420B8|nr:ATP-dependent zinc metalloprotease FtsH [Vaginisenegalia massiliensis]